MVINSQPILPCTCTPQQMNSNDNLMICDEKGNISALTNHQRKDTEISCEGSRRPLISPTMQSHGRRPWSSQFGVAFTLRARE